MSSASSESFTSSFPIWIPFISFSSPLAVLRNYRTMLNNSGKSRHACLVPDLRGNVFSFSPLRIMFAIGLSYMVFTILRQVPSMPIFWSFNHKWVLNFVKGFFCIYWDYHMVFIFQFVNMVYHIDWYQRIFASWCITLIDIKESLHPWNKPNSIMVYELFDVLLNSVC